MKILYALQGTGNGHIARANELIPHFKKHAKVDVFISGANSQLPLNFQAEYHSGLSLFYTKGGLDYKKMLTKNSMLKFAKAVKNFPLKKYDLVINDYEPITAYAAKFKNLPILGLSHQAAVVHKASPKPEKTDRIGATILKNYAPTKKTLGFHFQQYDASIFLPILRKSIYDLNSKPQNYYLVYLPSFPDQLLLKTLLNIDVSWKIFSPFTKENYKKKNCEFYAINQNFFLKTLENAKGVLCGAGFEFPSEVLHLKKQLFVIPIKGQYEQLCNYQALKQMNVSGALDLSEKKLKNWINSEKNLDYSFENQTQKVVEHILDNFLLK